MPYELPFWTIQGLPVRELTCLFEVRLTKEDRWYVYLDLRPRRDDHRDCFRRMRVVLDKDGYWMRQLWIESSSGNQKTWDYEKPDSSRAHPITRKEVLRDLPRGWKRVDRAPFAEPRSPRSR